MMELTIELLQNVIDLCKDCGAKIVIAKFTHNDEHQTRFSNSQIDINKQWREHVIDVFAATGRHTKILSIHNPEESTIKTLIHQGLKNLKSEPKSIAFWGIEKNKQNYPSKKDFIDDRIDAFFQETPVYVNSAIHAATELGSTKVAGVLYSGKKQTGLLSSKGNGGVYSTSYYRMTIRSFFDAESSGQDVIAGRSLQNIESKIIESAERSANIAKNAVNATQCESGVYDLILSPTVAGNIFGSIISGANPINHLMGTSPLHNKLGKKIGPDKLTIYDDPTHSEGLGSYPFDMEGVNAKPTPIIQNGVFKSLIHNTSSAKIWSLLGLIGVGKFGTRTTGNSQLGYLMMEGSGPRTLFPNSSNTVIKPGDYSIDEMVQESQNPTILVTSNWYTRFTNAREGTFSTIPRDGSFLIKDGEIVQSIKKFRISDNLLRMCENVTQIGKDTPQIYWWEVETPTFVPYIKIKGCNITTATN